MQKSDNTKNAVNAHRKVHSSTTLNRRYVKPVVRHGIAAEHNAVAILERGSRSRQAADDGNCKETRKYSSHLHVPVFYHNSPPSCQMRSYHDSIATSAVIALVYLT